MPELLPPTTATRLDSVRAWADGVLERRSAAEHRRAGYVHLYGVAQAATLLATRRGMDRELAAIAGLLHDLHTYASGIIEHHAASSAEMARPWLRDSGLFDLDEQTWLVGAIYHHTDKAGVHGEWDELLKDADLLQHWLYAPSTGQPAVKAARLRRVLAELGLVGEVIEARPKRAVRADLAGLAEAVAREAEQWVALGAEGRPDDERFTALCRPFGGPEVLDEFTGNWCAAFVYHCVRQAGLSLPIRHPGVSCRFGAVRGWLEWAELPAVALYHVADEAGFAPRRGDLVIYDDLLGNGPHDHIGIVTAVAGRGLTVAEGNADGANRAGLVARRSGGHLRGFIRLTDHYRYVQPDEHG